MTLSPLMIEGLTFKVADADERELALALRARVYREDLGHVPDDGLDATAHHLIASVANGSVVAAARVLGPEHRPFDFEGVVNLDEILPVGHRCGFIGRLCVERAYRDVRQSVAIQVGLMRLTVQFGLASAYSHYVLCAFRHLVAFYQRALFEPLDIEFNHPEWGPLYLMRLDLQGLVGRRDLSPVARLIFSTPPPRPKV